LLKINFCIKMNVYNNLIYVLIACVGFFLAYFVFSKNRKSSINIFFSLYTIFLIGWVISLYLFYNSDQQDVLFFGRLNFVVIEIVAYFGFYFGYFFPKKIFQFNTIFHIIVLLWLFFLVYLTMFTGLIDKNEIIELDGIKTVFGELYFIFVLHFIILVSLIFILPLCKYKKLNKLYQQQVIYFTLGSSLSIIIGTITNIIMPYFFDIYNLQIIGPIGLFFFFGFTSYAIIKHQLLDIKIVIQRSLVYSLVFSFIIGIYLFLIFIAGLFFSQSADLASITIALITTIISVYTVPMIERYFMRVTDYIFFKDKYDYSEALFDLSEVLNKNINLETLLKKIGVKLKEIFKIEQLLIILPERKIVLGIDGRISTKLNRHMEWYMRVIEGDNMLMINNSKEARLAKTADERKCEHESYKILLGNGKKFHVAMTVPIRLDNKLIGILAMGDKISGDMYTAEDCSLLKTFSYQAAVALEKSQLYEKAKNYSVELEKEVRERTGKIQSLQEEQKLMMLEIAHGMQTPLTIIKGEMRDLEEQIEDKKNIEVLENTIDRISKFIYDMLKLARMENQGSNFKKEKFDLSELLFELVESFEIICNDKDIKIEQDIASGIYMLGDQGEIAELITNLASNSIKYMDSQREKVIKLELKKDAGKIKFVLVDTGVGIDKDGLKKIFNRFYRINDDDHAGKSGTGLGLAICKEIVEHHNGTIEVRSEKGKGTVTNIYFPEMK